MNDPEASEPYRVAAAVDRFHVVDAAGQVVLVCGSQSDASQYAALLNQAYRRGYKAGYRQAKALTR